MIRAAKRMDFAIPKDAGELDASRPWGNYFLAFRLSDG